MSTVSSGTVGFFLPNIAYYLAHFHETAAHAAAEYVDNAHDEGASKIWLVLEPERIMIIDNGPGMLPLMHSDDVELVKMYKEEKGTQEDVRSFLEKPLSMKTFQWCMENVGLSSKIPEPGD